MPLNHDPAFHIPTHPPPGAGGEFSEHLFRCVCGIGDALFERKAAAVVGGAGKLKAQRSLLSPDC